MSTISKVKSKEREMTFLESRTTMPVKKLPVKNIASNMQGVVIDPIDPNRISKSTNRITMRSAIKAVLVFAGTTGLYHLFKNANVFSYFRWGIKNSKDIGDKGIVKVKNALNARRISKAIGQTNNPPLNRVKKAYKNEDGIVKFKEEKVKNFKNLPKAEENVGIRRSSSRRSMSIQNPIPDQNVTVGKSFSLTIDGSSVFSSNSSLFLEATNIPTWLNFLLLNPNPTFKGSYNTPSNAQDVTLSGNYAYVADNHGGLQIIDISDPSNPTFKGSYDTPNQAWNVAVSGNYAYVTDGNLQIIDIRDPANPTFKGSYDTPHSARDVALSGNYAYVVGGTSRSLQIIDISDPSNPTFKGSCDTLYLSKGVVVSGNYAYVADAGGGLQIIDISDPSNPTFKGLYDTSWAYGVVVSGNYAYVADDYSGLQIIDITNPANPTFKGSYDTPSAYGVAVSGNYAYIAGWSSGLQIIDISDPSNPTFKGSYDTLDRTEGVAVSGNYAYMADGYWGLQIIALNFDQLTLSGTSSSIGTYGVDIKACNEILECVTDSFNVTVGGNNAPIVANPLQNQITIVNALFNYVFPINTFFDSDGHSLTYTAKLSDDSSLPSWLNFNSLQREFFGTPTTLAIHPIKITANDSYNGTVSNSFNIIVKDIGDTTDTLDDTTDLTATLIISSMTVVVCIACIASFCLPLIIGGGIVMLRRHRNKILGSKDNTKTKELKEVNTHD
jgi:hypothetical protein